MEDAPAGLDTLTMGDQQAGPVTVEAQRQYAADLRAQLVDLGVAPSVLPPRGEGLTAWRLYVLVLRDLVSRHTPEPPATEETPPCPRSS